MLNFKKNIENFQNNNQFLVDQFLKTKNDKQRFSNTFFCINNECIEQKMIIDNLRKKVNEFLMKNRDQIFRNFFKNRVLSHFDDDVKEIVSKKTRVRAETFFVRQVRYRSFFKFRDIDFYKKSKFSIIKNLLNTNFFNINKYTSKTFYQRTELNEKNKDYSLKKHFIK